jgi:hypothetical protein
VLKGMHLTLLAGPVVPVPVPQTVLDALTGIEVTQNTDGPSGFQLTFSLSTRSPLQTIFLVTAGTTPMLRVVIVATVNGTPQVLMDGVMTRNDVSPGNEPGRFTLTITGEDLTKAMDLFDFTGLPYPAMPVEVRVLLILAKYAIFGMIPLVIPSLMPDVPIPIERIPTHKGTDLQYVRQLAAEAGYVFYVDPGPVPGTNTAYWGPEIKLGIPQPALNLDLDAHSNVQSLRFNFNTASTTLPVVLIQNSLTKIPIPLPIPKLNPLQPPLGAIPAPITNVTVLRETAKLSPGAAILRGLAAASMSADAVSGSGTLDVVRYGRLLKARSLVGVRGAGTAYDGLYFVKNVTSSIRRGEFKQSFNLTRNGLVSLTPTVPA